MHIHVMAKMRFYGSTDMHVRLSKLLQSGASHVQLQGPLRYDYVELHRHVRDAGYSVSHMARLPNDTDEFA